ncbi:hypothetical protein [Chamaesiphon sp.]|uniref:hypothetical protein n=1 Tax=Chamaesiphon sp. TaxID=2814140 RepID=UPI0035932592
MPNVEDRLPLLIQKQLNAQIEQRPPLFPWEAEVEDYETTEAESGNPILIKIPLAPLPPSSDV